MGARRQLDWWPHRATRGGCPRRVGRPRRLLFNTAGGMNFNRYSDWPWVARPLLWLFREVLLNPDGNGPKY